ncbi:MAG: pentapeptide repeat-containing protein [Planctomycetota bacterium]
MANQRHLAVVTLGKDGIRTWRDKNPGQPMDLSGAKLDGVDLRGAEFISADFRRCSLREADLAACGARGAAFDEAVLQRACFERADLEWASLVAVNAGGADLRRAKLAKANLEQADLTGADLSGADLSGASLVGATLYRTNLEGADLTGANLLGAQLKEARLRGARLKEASVIGAVVTKGALDGADLAGNPLSGLIVEEPVPQRPREAAPAPSAAPPPPAPTPVPMPILETRRGRLRIDIKENISSKSMVELLRALAQLSGLIDPASIVIEKMAIGLSENVMKTINEAELARSGDAPASRSWIAVEMAGRAAACAKECLDAVDAQLKMAATSKDHDANVISIRTIRLRKHQYENARWRLSRYSELGVTDADLVRKVEPLVERSVDPLAVLQELARDSVVHNAKLSYIGGAGADVPEGVAGASGVQAEVKRLIQALNSGDWHARWSAAVALGQIGPDAALAVPDLIECMKDEKRAVRYTAVCALSAIGAPAANAAVPALVTALRDSDLAVRGEAAKALKILSPE